MARGERPGRRCRRGSTHNAFAMDILYLLIPISVVLVFAIGGVFWWALGNGQFEDLEGPAHRVLMDDDHAEARRVPK